MKINAKREYRQVLNSTNYFKVNDESKYLELLKRLYSDQDGLEDSVEDNKTIGENGEEYHRFVAYGDLKDLKNVYDPEMTDFFEAFANIIEGPFILKTMTTEGFDIHCQIVLIRRGGVVKTTLDDCIVNELVKL